MRSTLRTLPGMERRCQLRMAEIVKEVFYHSCHMEIQGVDRSDLISGSIAKCSCGKTFIKVEDQRDGYYWKECNGDYNG